MILTIPVLRPGTAPIIRRKWTCPGGQLPEVLECGSARVQPGEKVVVKEVRYASMEFDPGQPWTIVIVTVEVPDDYDFSIHFENDNPKVGYTNADTREIAMKRAIATSKKPRTNDEIMADHNARMADAVPDGVTP